MHKFIMNPIIKQQLALVESADLSDFDEESGTFHIKKNKNIPVLEDCCYLVLLTPKARFNQVIKDNWNNGTFPKDDLLRIDIGKKIGKMIRVMSIGCNKDTGQLTNNFWNGWLSLDDIKIIKKL